MYTLRQKRSENGKVHKTIMKDNIVNIQAHTPKSDVSKERLLFLKQNNNFINNFVASCKSQEMSVIFKPSFYTVFF